MDDTFSDVMRRLREGSDEAARAVFQQFAHRLIGLPRLHLDARRRGKVDPEGVRQSVDRSFFFRHERGLFELESWDGLWSLLTAMTVNKCGRQCDLLREEAPPEVAAPRQPSPDEAAMMSDLLRTLLGGLDDKSRLVVKMRLQGHTLEEIASAAGVSDCTVSNLLAKLRERLARLLPEEP